MEYRGIEIKIMVDSDPMDPRSEFEPFGKMVCFHSRYNLGDPHDFRDSEHLMEWLEEQGDKVVYMPLYLYDHGGITMNTTGFSCGWDSGQVGVIFTEVEKADMWDLDWLQEKHGGDKMKALETVLKGEVKTYDQFLTGDVWGYEVEETNDSCWGFYGDDHENNGLLEYARNAIDSYLSQKAKQDHLERLQRTKELKQSFAFRRRKKASRAL